MQAKKVTLSFRIFLVAAFASISYLATTRVGIHTFDINDKLNHVFAFLTLALLADFSWPVTKFNFAKVLSLLGYGIAIETVQYFLAYRSFSFFDVGADAIGLFLYWMAVPFLTNLPLLNSRWKADAVAKKSESI
jgi:VanZ family protein